MKKSIIFNAQLALFWCKYGADLIHILVGSRYDLFLENDDQPVLWFEIFKTDFLYKTIQLFSHLEFEANKITKLFICIPITRITKLFRSRFSRILALVKSMV